MPKLIFHPEISSEIKAYQEQAAGLGDDFIAELEAAYEVITELPETWPKLQKGFRRFLLTRFPYSVIYKHTSERIFIVAVMHNSRKPGYWLSRI